MGLDDGVNEGAELTVGAKVVGGLVVGLLVGEEVGDFVGEAVGDLVGLAVGDGVAYTNWNGSLISLPIRTSTSTAAQVGLQFKMAMKKQ